MYSRQTDRAYNSLGRSVHLELQADGYILAVEKRRRSKVGDPPPLYTRRFRDHDGRQDSQAAQDKRREIYRRVCSGSRSMLITHVTSFFEGWRRFLFNPYAQAEDHRAELDYEAGYEALELFEQDLRTRLSPGHEYSHLLVMAMGWNNDQHESIRRYNLILKHMRAAASTSSQRFHPLVIGWTWPSAWNTLSDNPISRAFGFIGSYYNKVDDADEIGFTLANWLFHRILTGLRDELELPPVVALGHSMGARLLSRALFSRGHLLETRGCTASPVNLFIGLQSAFSVRRFLAGQGSEGSPYADFAAHDTRWVMTSSKEDEANPWGRVASGARHIGGKHGLKIARNEPELFDVLDWPDPAGLHRSLGAEARRVVVLDAGLKHNEILHEAMGELIWQCLAGLKPE